MAMRSEMKLPEDSLPLNTSTHNKANKEYEASIQKAIFECIDEFCSFRFNAGAGSGKTFALIETLKYILKSKLRALESQNQQVVCITYTNVAVREIEKRLGLSGTILVSTIHERMWKLIESYQRELILLHAEKLNKEIDSITKAITDPDSRKFSKFSQLLDNYEFKDFIIKTQSEYKSLLDLSAAEFKTKYQQLASSLPCINKSVLSNVGNFKDFLDKRYKQIRYIDCLERINSGKEKKITYDSRSNSDQLDRMRFSHDTLLEYIHSLIIKYPTLQRLIVDKFPYFLVDEYQDTHENVVRILCTLREFAKKNNKQWLVGYFGDTAQKIYGDGVGKQIAALHPDLTPITKLFNRRSHTQIIDVSNKIRSDEIQQKPFDEEKNNGIVEFYSFDRTPEVDIKEVIVQFLAASLFVSTRQWIVSLPSSEKMLLL